MTGSDDGYNSETDREDRYNSWYESAHALCESCKRHIHVAGASCDCSDPAGVDFDGLTFCRGCADAAWALWWVSL